MMRLFWGFWSTQVRGLLLGMVVCPLLALFLVPFFGEDNFTRAMGFLVCCTAIAFRPIRNLPSYNEMFFGMSRNVRQHLFLMLMHYLVVILFSFSYAALCLRTLAPNSVQLEISLFHWVIAAWVFIVILPTAVPVLNNTKPTINRSGVLASILLIWVFILVCVLSPLAGFLILSIGSMLRSFKQRTNIFRLYTAKVREQILGFGVIFCLLVGLGGAFLVVRHTGRRDIVFTLSDKWLGDQRPGLKNLAIEDVHYPSEVTQWFKVQLQKPKKEKEAIPVGDLLKVFAILKAQCQPGFASGFMGLICYDQAATQEILYDLPRFEYDGPKVAAFTQSENPVAQTLAYLALKSQAEENLSAQQKLWIGNIENNPSEFVHSFIESMEALNLVKVGQGANEDSANRVQKFPLSLMIYPEKL